MPAAAAAMARPAELESRLLAVLDSRARRTPLAPATLGLLVAGALVVATPAAALRFGQVPPALPTGLALPPELDRLGDELADPRSELLPVDPPPPGAGSTAALLAGPDSSLARLLLAAATHRPVHRSDLIGERARWVLSRARSGRLLPPLLEGLADTDWRVQSYAAWAVAYAADPSAVPRLIPLLGHPVWRLRAMAAFALRAGADRRAFDSMTGALQDAAWQVRAEAVGYFGHLADPSMRSRLRLLLRDRHPAVRHAAEQALSTIQD
jgi:hypothetical protein